MDMLRAIVVCAALLGSTLAAAQSPQIVRVKKNDIIGCNDVATLREVHRTLSRYAPGPGWETGITEIGCGLVASDLHWRFADLIGDVAMVQLQEPGIEMRPVMAFRVMDLVNADGTPFRPQGRPAPIRR
jgi:hypothetical protein